MTNLELVLEIIKTECRGTKITKGNLDKLNSFRYANQNHKVSAELKKVSNDFEHELRKKAVFRGSMNQVATNAANRSVSSIVGIVDFTTHTI